jgi:hypothetical protein
MYYLNGQIDGQAYRYLERQIDGRTNRWIFEWLDRSTGLQMLGQTDRCTDKLMDKSGNTKEGSIIVPLTSCLTGLD